MLKFLKIYTPWVSLQGTKILKINQEIVKQKLQNKEEIKLNYYNMSNWLIHISILTIPLNKNKFLFYRY